jgi:hypothetical protein
MARRRYYRQRKRSSRKRQPRRSQHQRMHHAPMQTINIWLAIAGALFYFLSRFLD